LDNYIRFAEGLVTIITGSPGSGKSEFLDYIISHLAVNQNWKFGVFSFENQPTKIHDAKLIEKMSGKAFGFRKDLSNRVNQETIELVKLELFDKFKLMDKTKIDLSLEGILTKCEELIMKFGIKGIVIDPYNKIIHNIQNGMSETNYINTFMTRITSFAVKWNVHIFLVAHPTKLITDKNTKKQERPTLYSIAGSANFYNQTDNGFVVYRDKETGIVDVYIEKIRFSEQGQLGFVSFTFNTLTRQYIYATSKHPLTTEAMLESTKVSYSGNLEFGDEQPF
jgi:twinkle protein